MTEEVIKKIFLSSDENDMMVADRVCEEVFTADLFAISVKFKDYLGPAQSPFREVCLQFCTVAESSRHITGYLDYRGRSLRHLTLDRYSKTGLEMRIKRIASDHIQRNRTMSQSHFSLLRIDTGRIGLEATLAGL